MKQMLKIPAVLSRDFCINNILFEPRTAVAAEQSARIS